jgi:hypothetical protein
LTTTQQRKLFDATLHHITENSTPKHSLFLSSPDRIAATLTTGNPQTTSLTSHAFPGGKGARRRVILSRFRISLPCVPFIRTPSEEIRSDTIHQENSYAITRIERFSDKNFREIMSLESILRPRKRTIHVISHVQLSRPLKDGHLRKKLSNERFLKWRLIARIELFENGT